MNDPDSTAAIATVGARLRALRGERDLTLAVLAQQTGISVSTLSRLESGRRKATLELLLPVASALGVSLDDLVRSEPQDPRVRQVPQKIGSHTSIPLTRQPGNLQAYKLIVEPTDDPVTQKTHEGYEWFYVLSGKIRLRLGDRETVLRAGEAAEFDTRVPHWFGAVDGPAELLSLFGKQGERIHLRARTGR
ncbi:XRE family transcriptional regulator [Rhodococcus sp. HNM0569]|uniref:helix-turn-helix domain-containing protein n=1 Tax=Rhodococcus sp. HNM0569 TaxID=2716340 RepID=UPI00146F23DA|nr:XRE family transcriptional regulator [Rhodococcus sp. HNM0569]NLU81999.1 helix-turn-helix transcriptional regulator [Rhodococcus sp. HNM0569]